MDAAAMIREAFANERALEGAALAAMPGPAVKVKPLEWAGKEARSPVGCYRVQRLDGKWEPLRDGYYMLPRLHGIVKAFDTIEAAKAAAQADYEARILSALMPAPDLAAENERLGSAMERIAVLGSKLQKVLDRSWRLNTRREEADAENERLRAALEKVVDWASRRCPADDESVPCQLCGARADIPGDFCKAVESIFPRDLLRDTRAALERT